MFFKNFKKWETELAGRKLTLETGKMAGLANASVMARYGDTNVLCMLLLQQNQEKALTSSRFQLTTKKKCTRLAEFPDLSREEKADRQKKQYSHLAA